MTTPKAKLAGLALIAALCAGFTLGLTAPAWAGLDEATAAYIRGDYATAIREWRPLAKQGVADAQYNLGIMYDHGEGVPQECRPNDESSGMMDRLLEGTWTCQATTA